MQYKYYLSTCPALLDHYTTATEAGKCTGLFWLDRQPQATHLLAKTQETAQQREQLRLSLLSYQQRFMAVPQ